MNRCARLVLLLLAVRLMMVKGVGTIVMETAG